MSASVEVGMSKVYNGFDTTFPASFAHLLARQPYTEAVTRINTTMQAVVYPRLAFLFCLAFVAGGGCMIGFGIVDRLYFLIGIGFVLCIFCGIFCLAYGAVIKARRVRQALDSAMRIENDRFSTAQPPVSFRLFEQKTEELVRTHDTNSIGPTYQIRTHIAWKLIVEVGLRADMQPVSAQVIQAYPVGQEYARPYVTQAGFAQPGQYVQPGYAQPGPYTQQGYAQPAVQLSPLYAQPPVATPARNEDVNAPLMAAPEIVIKE